MFVVLTKLLFQCTTDAESPSVVSVTTAASSGKDSVDEELFDFLNNSSPAVNESQRSDGRPSSSASSQSQKTPELQMFVGDVAAANDHIGAAFFDSKHCMSYCLCFVLYLLHCIVCYWVKTSLSEHRMY